MEKYHLQMAAKSSTNRSITNLLNGSFFLLLVGSLIALVWMSTSWFVNYQNINDNYYALKLALCIFWFLIPPFIIRAQITLSYTHYLIPNKLAILLERWHFQLINCGINYSCTEFIADIYCHYIEI